MESQKTPCCKSKPIIVLEKTPSRRNGFISFLSTALIIILPKCPFCIAAYSSAFMMFYEVDNASLAPIFLHLKPLLGVLVLGLILFNFKGRKSQIATFIVLIALIFLLLGTYGNVHLIPNWIIYSAFFFGAWYNGNFQYFYRYLKVKTP
jgi:chromate transport protein ChrA